MSEPDSKKTSILKEWNLFWESFLDEDEAENSSSKTENGCHELSRIEKLNIDQIKKLRKALSQDRKSIHQKLEKLNKEIELNQAKMESLILVSGNTLEIERRIEELHDLGRQLSESLHKIDHKIKVSRDYESTLEEYLL